MKDDFLKYYKTKDIDLRNRIIEENLYIVDILVNKYKGKGVDYDDLYQIGSLALIGAVERFDPTKGYEFSTFATPTIIGDIKKYFRDKVWIARVPRGIKELSLKIQSTREILTAELGRTPNMNDIAERLGISIADVLEADEAGMAYEAVSLNKTIGDEEQGEAFEKFVSTEETGYETYELTDAIKNALDKMSENSRFIFRERFIEGKSQQEIADRLGISQMTVSRAEKAIRKKLQEELKAI